MHACSRQFLSMSIHWSRPARLDPRDVQYRSTSLIADSSSLPSWWPVVGAASSSCARRPPPGRIRMRLRVLSSVPPCLIARWRTMREGGDGDRRCLFHTIRVGTCTRTRLQISMRCWRAPTKVRLCLGLV
jgi:hypothetical protein